MAGSKRSGDSNGRPVVKKARTTTACVPCAKARRKCDSTQPTCKVCDALGRECEYRLAAAANDSDEGSAPSKSRKSKKAVTSPTSVPNGLPVASTSAYTLPTTAEGIAGSVDSYSRSAGVESTIMLLEQLLAKYKGTSAVSPTEQDALSSMRSTLREDEQEIVQAAIKDMARQQQQQQQQQQQEQ